MSLFLLPGAKYAQKVDVNTALYESIASSSSEKAAATVSTACRAFQELRAAVNEPPYGEVNRRQLKTYLVALTFLLNETKIQPTLPVKLLWVNAFDGEDQCSLSDIRIDKLAVIFNLGVCEAHLANSIFRQRRADANAMKLATHHFRNAAGYFCAAGDLPIPGGFHAATTDLYPPALKALEMAMLGNAQQALYEIALEGGNSHSVLARFAIGARDFYAIAEESCREPDVVNTTINAYVGRPAAALAAYFDVIAEWSMATAAREEHDMAQQLKRLALAQHSLQVSLQTAQVVQNSSGLASVNNLRGALTTELEEFRKRIADRKSSAEQENRTIYFMTPASEVPQILPRQSVRPTDVQKTLNDEPVDERLLPLKELQEMADPQLSGIASRYLDMVTQTVTDKVTEINRSADDLRGTVLQAEATIASRRAMAESEIQKSSAVSPSTLEDDQRAIDMLKATQDQGGIGALLERQSQLVNLSGEAKSQLQSIETMLRAEEAEDRQLRMRSSVHRRTSVELTEPYWSAVMKIKSNLEMASRSDSKATAEIEYHSNVFAALGDVKVLDFIPPSAKSGTSTVSEQQAQASSAAAQAETQIEDAQRLLAEKDELVREFESMQELENPHKITSSIVEDGAEVDKLTALIQTRYGGIQVKARKACDEMDRLSSELADSTSRLQQPVQTSDNMEEAQARMNEIYRHQAPAQKFDELMDHLRQGTEFYCREQDCIMRLKKDVEGYVAARQHEARDITSNSYQQPIHGSAGYPSQGGMYPPHDSSYSQNGQPYSSAPATSGPYSGSHSIWRRQ